MRIRRTRRKPVLNWHSLVTIQMCKILSDFEDFDEGLCLRDPNQAIYRSESLLKTR